MIFQSKFRVNNQQLRSRDLSVTIPSHLSIVSKDVEMKYDLSVVIANVDIKTVQIFYYRCFPFDF